MLIAITVDFVIVRFLMKLFNTTNMDIINNCRQYFDVKLPSYLWCDRVRRFEKKVAECDNIFLQNFSLNSIVYDQLYSPEGRKTEEKKHTRINLTN